MALLKTLDVDYLTRRLGDWLAHVLPGAKDIEIDDVVIPTSSGLSMTTVLFTAAYTDADGQRHRLDLVARVAPEPENRLFEDMDLPRDFAVARALNEGTDIAVPAAQWLETDPQWLGQPFVVSDRVYGQVPADDPPWSSTGWVMELAPERRGRLISNGLEVLAAIHALDWRGIGLGFLDSPELGPTGIAQEIERNHQAYRWVAGDAPSPTIDTGFAWVRENQPAAQGPPVLCWGDSRPGNLMYGDDESVQGVLDWEMATLGPPELDLGWWLCLQRHHTEEVGVPLPEGIPSRDQTIALYEQISGRTVHDIEYFEVFAALRMSILFMRVGQLLIAGGALPQGHLMPYVNPSSMLLATLLGLPLAEAENVVIAGEGGSFLGAREGG